MRAAIVLGGGRSSRMGTDKLALTLDGETLLARTCAAAARAAERVVVAGHERPVADVEFVLEDPPFGGPVAGIAAGVGVLDRAWMSLDTPSLVPHEGTRDSDTGARDAEVLILAGDLANPAGVVELLVCADMGVDGVVLADEEGWPQYLAGRYRLDSVRRALGGAAILRDISVRRVLRVLNVTLIAASQAVTADIDTPVHYATHGLHNKIE